MEPKRIRWWFENRLADASLWLKRSTCKALGHRREAHVYGRRIDRNGLLRDKWGFRCGRCGTSGDACHDPGVAWRIWDGIRQRMRAATVAAHGHPVPGPIAFDDDIPF